jgi:SAM-dependent methyltransferase
MKAVADERIRSAKPARRISLTLAAIPPIPFPNATFDAIFMAFTLELFPDDTIPLVLSEACRTLRPGGRLSVVPMAHDPAQSSRQVGERIYWWIHRHFPHIVDCRPMDVEWLATDAGFAIAQVERLEGWGLPEPHCSRLSPSVAVPLRRPRAVEREGGARCQRRSCSSRRPSPKSTNTFWSDLSFGPSQSN